MGNNAQLFCMKCNQRTDLGRAYHYNKEATNKELSKDTLTQLKLAKARFELSLQKIEMFGEDYTFDWFDEEIAFLEEHKGHKMYLINDYFNEGGIK